MVTLASLVERARRVPLWAADTALALTIFATGVVEVVFFAQKTLVVQPFRVTLVWSIPLFAVMSVPLAIRRRSLWTAYILIETAALVAARTHLVVAYGLGSLLIFNVLLFTVGEQSNGLVTTALTLGQVGYYYSIEFEVPAASRDPGPLLYSVTYYLPFLGLAAFAGWAQRRRRRLTANLEVRAAQLQRERELLAGQAVAQERIRIAHELRALVVEGVDRMTRFAESARRDVEREPGRGQAEIAAIETAGRGTLVEMRRLLGVLRRTDLARDQITAADERGKEGEKEPDRGPARGRSAGLMEMLRTWPGPSWLIDTTIAAAIGGLAMLAFSRADPTDPTLRGWLPRALASIIVLAILFRRAAPFSALIVVATSEFVWILLRDNSPGFADRALLVAIYTVAAHKDIGWGIAGVGMGILAWSPLPLQSLCLCLIDNGALSVFAVIAGHSMLVGRRVNRQLEEQTELLERTRHERVRLAVGEERTRVAREMHDVVAHAVTGMVVQAGGARMVAASDPRLAVETLEDVQQMGREALQELRALVEALDPDPVRIGAKPHEDAPDVGSLIERVRRAGQEVVFLQEGEAHVDRGLQISLYRIVQEALTNVRKHAPGARTTVTIRHVPQAVEVEITNGACPAINRFTAVPGAGQGLIGIRERASVFGGTAEAGPDLEGGFSVSARLPLELLST